jgi:citrate synthase
LSTLINMDNIDKVPGQKSPGIAASGLEDVVAATTRLSDVNGDEGKLILAGRPVEDLAGRITFEDVIHLLWRGTEPTVEERARIQRLLGEARETAFERLSDLGDALTMPDAMDALRAALGHVTAPRTTPIEEALVIAGAAAVFAAAWARQSDPVRPDAKASHAADYLRMATGKAPTRARVEALDAYLVTVVDHGMNASTFTARVVASTASDTVSAIVAALGALKGKLHGGAPGPVLDMLDAIRADVPDDGVLESAARTWLEAALARGERIMGMGHRVYRVRDPRAFVLERALAKLESAENARLRLARAVETEAERLLAARHPNRALRANVEFYTAVLLEAIGLPRTLFTPTFAVGRVAGWCAHVEEQRRVGRLIRPRSRYVDVMPNA